MFGQTSELILTKEQNNRWFEKLKNLDNKNQLEYIKTRMLNDTIVYNSEQSYHSMITENYKKDSLLKEFGFIAEGCILYFIGAGSKGRLTEIQFDNWTETSFIKTVHDFLTLERIQNIKMIRDDTEEEAIFGGSAGYGVIIFEMKKGKYIKQFKDLGD